MHGQVHIQMSTSINVQDILKNTIMEQQGIDLRHIIYNTYIY